MCVGRGGWGGVGLAGVALAKGGNVLNKENKLVKVNFKSLE